MKKIYTEKYRFAIIAQKAGELRTLMDGINFPIIDFAVIDHIKRAATAELARITSQNAARKRRARKDET